MPTIRDDGTIPAFKVRRYMTIEIDGHVSPVVDLVRPRTRNDGLSIITERSRKLYSAVGGSGGYRFGRKSRIKVVAE